MAFHRQKYSVQNNQITLHNYRLKEHILKDSSKYLRVDIQSNLHWNMHIDRVTKKANGWLGFLHRNPRATSEETKTNAYISMIKSNLHYCAGFGVFITRNRSRRLRWFSALLPVIQEISIETPAVLQTCYSCLITYSGRSIVGDP